MQDPIQAYRRADNNGFFEGCALVRVGERYGYLDKAGRFRGKPAKKFIP